MKGIEHNEQMGDWYEAMNLLPAPEEPIDTTSANENPFQALMIGLPIGIALWVIIYHLWSMGGQIPE